MHRNRNCSNSFPRFRLPQETTSNTMSNFLITLQPFRFTLEHYFGALKPCLRIQDQSVPVFLAFQGKSSRKTNINNLLSSIRQHWLEVIDQPPFCDLLHFLCLKCTAFWCCSAAWIWTTEFEVSFKCYPTAVQESRRLYWWRNKSFRIVMAQRKTQLVDKLTITFLVDNSIEWCAWACWTGPMVLIMLISQLQLK